MQHFNPRTYKECDGTLLYTGSKRISFQSAHPSRDAIVILMLLQSVQKYFNPRTAYGMRQTELAKEVVKLHFNPRIPHGIRID